MEEKKLLRVTTALLLVFSLLISCGGGGGGSDASGSGGNETMNNASTTKNAEKTTSENSEKTASKSAETGTQDKKAKAFVVGESKDRPLIEISPIENLPQDVSYEEFVIKDINTKKGINDVVNVAAMHANKAMKDVEIDTEALKTQGKELLVTVGKNVFSSIMEGKSGEEIFENAKGLLMDGAGKLLGNIKGIDPMALASAGISLVGSMMGEEFQDDITKHLQTIEDKVKSIQVWLQTEEYGEIKATIEYLQDWTRIIKNQEFSNVTDIRTMNNQIENVERDANSKIQANLARLDSLVSNFNSEEQKVQQILNGTEEFARFMQHAIWSIHIRSFANQIKAALPVNHSILTSRINSVEKATKQLEEKRDIFAKLVDIRKEAFKNKAFFIESADEKNTVYEALLTKLYHEFDNQLLELNKIIKEFQISFERQQAGIEDDMKVKVKFDDNGEIDSVSKLLKAGSYEIIDDNLLQTIKFNDVFNYESTEEEEKLVRIKLFDLASKKILYSAYGRIKEIDSENRIAKMENSNYTFRIAFNGSGYIELLSITKHKPLMGVLFVDESVGVTGINFNEAFDPKDKLSSSNIDMSEFDLGIDMKEI